MKKIFIGLIIFNCNWFYAQGVLPYTDYYKTTQEKYPKTMTFEITQQLNAMVNDKTSKIQTSFEVEFLVLEKKPNFNVYQVSKTKVVNHPSQENTFLAFLESLEELTYPIKIQTTSQGEFVKMVEYKEWLEKWEENTALLMQEYEGDGNAKDILEKFNLNIYNEKNFTQNKFKEPFWNLIFFNPKVDQDDVQANQTINWNIKTIGKLECTGKTKFTKSDQNETLLCFESQQIVNTDCMDMINFKTSNETNPDPYVADVKIITAFDGSLGKIKCKSSVFEIQSENFQYKEETILKIKSEPKSK
ncbi:hypothetical protein [Flavobacterium branchiicola]|uniref:GLPGLI family protein n=1 Tax=Flavobacterium branchiicola TaxID=1114875 RepID=A0ABV9PC54_9FLAO|nr:hypothetical protein [Flavobacterium branchiicola]MBS7253707.1 hypothetical protein [Flavobacterium branchiicola]